MINKIAFKHGKIDKVHFQDRRWAEKGAPALWVGVPARMFNAGICLMKYGRFVGYHKKRGDEFWITFDKYFCIWAFSTRSNQLENKSARKKTTARQEKGHVCLALNKSLKK